MQVESHFLCLPKEIRQLIFFQVPVQDWPKLLLTCKRIFAELSPLFREVGQLVSCFDREVGKITRVVTNSEYERRDLNDLNVFKLFYALFILVTKEKPWNVDLIVADLRAIDEEAIDPKRVSLETLKSSMMYNWEYHPNKTYEEARAEINQSFAIFRLCCEERSLEAVVDEMYKIERHTMTTRATYIEKLQAFCDPKMSYTLRPLFVALDYWHNRNERLPEKRVKIRCLFDDFEDYR